jgi:hypothetical protein
MSSLSITIAKLLDTSALRVTGLTHWIIEAISELMVTLVPPSEWHQFNDRVYTRITLYTSDHHNSTLFDWERRVIDNYFPHPPARILIGAAGGGREMLYLSKMGYDVAGFEPIVSLVNNIQRIIDKNKLLCSLCAGYEELTNGIPIIESNAPFQAIILGWTSLAHVGEEPIRKKLFQKLRQLCPAGPVLVSWTNTYDTINYKRKMLRSLLMHLGAQRQSIADYYNSYSGFLHPFTVNEIEALAKEGGYSIAMLSRQSHPYAVFIPNNS